MMIKPISAAGGVIYRLVANSEEPEVLLIFRNEFWDLPKGKLEKGETILMCAVREISEETGSELPILISDLVTTYHEYKEKKKKFGKTTFWYSMIYPRKQKLVPQSKEGIEKIQWVRLSKAKEKVAFDNLKEVLESFEKNFF